MKTRVKVAENRGKGSYPDQAGLFVVSLSNVPFDTFQCEAKLRLGAGRDDGAVDISVDQEKLVGRKYPSNQNI